MRMRMMMLLLRFYRSCYLGEAKYIDKSCGITIAVFFLYLEEGIIRSIWCCMAFIFILCYTVGKSCSLDILRALLLSYR
jgi:hypothetical protein